MMMVVATWVEEEEVSGYEHISTEEFSPAELAKSV